MEELKEKLSQAGLTRNESKVYLELLKTLELSANEISKKVSLDRTLTYSLLNNLIEKGLISYIIKENKKFFKAENPENLLNQIRKKEFLIKDLIIDLNKIQKQNPISYEIKVLEGKEGLRTLFGLIFKNKHFLSFGGTGRAYEQLYEIQAMAKALKKGEYSGKMILQEKYRDHEVTKQSIIKSRYSNVNAEATTVIFGNYVSIHLAKEKPKILLIKNKDIAESYKNYFKVLWKIAKI